MAIGINSDWDDVPPTPEELWSAIKFGSNRPWFKSKRKEFLLRVAADVEKMLAEYNV